MLTIVTPIYNSSNNFHSLFNNVSQLLSENVNWIIVDDASTDDTVKVILALIENNEYITLCHMDENSGPNMARRTGVSHSGTDLIYFLDSDDYIYPEAFFEFMSFVGQNLNYDYFYAPIYGVINGNDKENIKNHIKEDVKVIKKPTDFFKFGFPQPSSLVVKKNKFLKSDVESKLCWGEDFLTFLCLSTHGLGIRWSKPVSCYVISGLGRGSILSLRTRLKLSVEIFKYVILIDKGKNKIDGFLYLLILTSKHIASFIFKKYIKSKIH